MQATQSNTLSTLIRFTSPWQMRGGETGAKVLSSSRFLPVAAGVFVQSTDGSRGRPKSEVSLSQGGLSEKQSEGSAFAVFWRKGREKGNGSNIVGADNTSERNTNLLQHQILTRHFFL